MTIKEELCRMCPESLSTPATRYAKLILGSWVHVCESCFKLYSHRYVIEDTTYPECREEVGNND